RANAAGELGKVIGLVQPVEGLAPQPAVDEIVPFGDEVVDRTARRHALEERTGVAERHAAIHAAGALRLQLLVLGVFVELEPVADALPGRARQRQLAREFQESGWLTHCALSK